jgi:DinB superfamily
MSQNIAELLERYRRGPESLATVLTGILAEEEDFLAAPGKWSIRQILAHLADTELVLAHRFRQLIAEDRPTLISIDQGAWARHLDYDRREPAQSLETLRRTRAENYDLLKAQPVSAYDRAGNHTERGPTTLGQMLEYYCAHTESHNRQIGQAREAYKNR